MSRGTVPGLQTAHPLVDLLPGLLASDDFAQRFTAGLDEVLAPVFLALDCFDSYLDPKLAPPDFVAWLADWVAAELDDTWSDQRRRAVVAAGLRMHRRRGTVHGLKEHVQLATGLRIEIEESGGASWSPEPGSRPPGHATPGLTVRLRIADPGSVDHARLNRAVREACPAHVPFRIEVTS